MPQKKGPVPTGESSISKEKPTIDTFASIPDPEEFEIVMSEVEAESISEMPTLDITPVDDGKDAKAVEEIAGESEPEADGQIDLPELPSSDDEENTNLNSENTTSEKSELGEENAEAKAMSLDESDVEEENTLNAPEQLTIDIDDEPKKETVKKKDDRYDPKNPRKIDSVFEFIELIIFTFLAVMVVSSFFFRHAEVVGSSMEGTLYGGDHLIISDFFYTPERGDIIVCSDYSTEFKSPIVKRVIGIAGDVIKIDSDGNVWLNDEILDEPYVYGSTQYAYKEGEWTVPDGEVFVMGDHRSVSFDSRSIGTIKVDSILGKVLLRFYPLDKFGPVN